MFPLRDFLKRHAKKVELDEACKDLHDLFPNSTGIEDGSDVFLADNPGFEGGLFQFDQGGYKQPLIWKADIVILPDSLTAILLTTKGNERSATSALVDSLTSAIFKPGKNTRSKTHAITDE